jgi:hypothetical protein
MRGRGKKMCQGCGRVDSVSENKSNKLEENRTDDNERNKTNL